MSQQSADWVKINPEYLAMVPRLSKDQYKSLKNSIREDGLQVPIIVNNDGEILDGHTRFQACTELKIKPKFVVKSFDDPDKEREFVVVTNLARRQLTLFQRGEICFNFYEKERATRYQRAGEKTWKVRRGEKEAIPEGPEKRASRLLSRFGQMIGTGSSTAHMLVWLIENADESTKDLLRNEQLKIPTAYKRLKNPNWKPRAAYGTYLRHPYCLACGLPTKSASETGCHVHAGMCCTGYGWGN